MPDYQTVRGWRFPADVDVPESHWFQTSGSWTLGWQGFVDIAHQKGLESMDAEVVATGEDPEMNIPYVIARGEVTVDGDTYAKLASTDSQTNGLEDIGSTACSKAQARAIRVALNIIPVDGGGESSATGGASAPDDFDPDDGHALADDADSGGETPAVGDDSGDGW